MILEYEGKLYRVGYATTTGPLIPISSDDWQQLDMYEQEYILTSGRYPVDEFVDIITIPVKRERVGDNE